MVDQDRRFCGRSGTEIDSTKNCVPKDARRCIVKGNDKTGTDRKRSRKRMKPPIIVEPCSHPRLVRSRGYTKIKSRKTESDRKRMLSAVCVGLRFTRPPQYNLHTSCKIITDCDEYSTSMTSRFSHFSLTVQNYWFSDVIPVPFLKNWQRRTNHRNTSPKYGTVYMPVAKLLPTVVDVGLP